MKDGMDKSPYLAPEAPLEDAAASGLSRVGRFWGLVFALPMGALVLLSLLVSMRYWIQGNHSSGLFGLAVAMWCGLFTVLILWSGTWWARRFGAGRWMPLFGFALACGAAGQVLFWAGVLVILPVAMPKLDVPILSGGNALGSLMGWLGMSLYALLHALMVRWSLRRIARKRTRASR